MSNIDRRQFVLGAAAIGLSGSALTVLLDACNRKGSTTTEGWPVDLKSANLQIHHLLRRAGFSPNQSEIDKYSKMGVKATTQSLLDYEKVDNTALENRLAGITVDTKNLADLQRWWLLRMVYTQRPLQEKMTLFLHGLLTSGFSKVVNGPYMLAQNKLLRSQAIGDYGELLKAISRDPAMMLWLDSATNHKATPNENFARELMELFSLGIGNYTETDVREAARAFTGWELSNGAFVFNTAQHDTGSKTFLGQTGNFTGDDIIDIIMKQPAAAKFICRKMFEFFVYDNPDDPVVSHLAAVFTQNNRSLKAVMNEILSSTEFYSANAYRAKVKSPVELVAGMIRGLNIETNGLELVNPVNGMGQSLFNPPNVAGWKGGTSWINSATMIYRLNFANTVATARQKGFVFDPAQTLLQNGVAQPQGAVDYFTNLLIDGVIPDSERKILLSYLNVSSSTTVSSSSAWATDEQLRSLTYLVLCSPDYQLA